MQAIKSELDGKYCALLFFRPTYKFIFFKIGIEYSIKLLTIFHYNSHYWSSNTGVELEAPPGLPHYPGTSAGIGLIAFS